MWIARTAGTKEKQDIINIQKRKISEAELAEEKTTADQNNVSKDNDSKESGVSLTLSEEAKKMSDVQKGMSFQEYKELVDNFRQQKEGAEEAGKIWSRCMTIAIRIGGGDKVPLKDERYLQEHEPKLYMSAMTMRMLKEDPKEYDSILEDEDENQDASGPVVSEAASGTSGENTDTSDIADTADTVVSAEGAE